MKEKEVAHLLEQRGCVLRGSHFVYTSGRHGQEYVDKNVLLADAQLAELLSKEMAERVALDPDLSPEVIIGAAMSGALLAHHLASKLHAVSADDIYAVYTEKDGLGIHRLGRGFDQIVRDRRVLVVEDVINLGATAKSAAHAAVAAGGTVVGVAVIWNRGKADMLRLPDAGGGELRLPIHALVHRPFPSYSPEECLRDGPCAAGSTPVVDLGHGASFLAKRREQA